MPQLLELWDHSQPGVFASLPEVLSVLPPEAHTLQWRILWLEPLAHPNSNLDLTHFGFGAHLDDGFGLETTWADLEHLASITIQIPDGLIVAPRPGCRPRATDSDDRLLALSTVVLAPFDSTFWHLWVPDRWVRHLQAAFADLRPARPGARPLTT